MDKSKKVGRKQIGTTEEAFERHRKDIQFSAYFRNGYFFSKYDWRLRNAGRFNRPNNINWYSRWHRKAINQSVRD